MPRSNTNSEVFKSLSEFGFFRDAATPAATTTSAAAAFDAVSITVVSATGLAAGDYIRIDSGQNQEIAQIASIATLTLTLKSKLALAHISGVEVKKVSKTKLGDLTEEGVSMESNTETTDIRSATYRGLYARLIRNVTQRFTFGVLNMSPENLLAALGIPETLIRGTGTSSDPYVVNLDPQKYATDTNQALYFTGSMFDGRTVEVQGWGLNIEASQSVQFQTGGQAPVPFAVTANMIRVLINS